MRIAFYLAAPLGALAILPIAGCGHEKSNNTATNATDRTFDTLVNEDALKDEEVELNRRCRDGSGDDPVIQKACDRRDEIIGKLKDVGICWGAANQIEANKTWVKCGDGDTPPTQATTF